MAAASSPWFPPCRAGSQAAPLLRPGAIRLFCLPHAGAGASAYRDWPHLLAPDVEVVPIQLPGRESRHRELPRRSVFDLTAELADPLADRAGSDFALFGHSMGALLAYELARALAARGMPPRHLFVSGLGAPHLPPVRPDAYLLPDDELVALLSELEGTSPAVLAQPELLQLLLPVLRADFEVCGTYRHPDRSPLHVPITALGGEGDRGVGTKEIRAWQELTSAAFRAELFPAGHFYLHSMRDELLQVLVARLSDPAACPPPAGPLPGHRLSVRHTPDGDRDHGQLTRH
jgi:medium-chain acyl-[acyl-carrier-protein] hydrolase